MTNVPMKTVKKESESGADDSSSSGSNSGSNSSDDDDDEEDSEMRDEEAKSKQLSIEVPLSVIQRFFSKKDVIMTFLQKINKESTHAMLDDLCATYQFND